jgi:hypothetical protein
MYCAFSLPPIIPIQTPEIDSFGEVFVADVDGTVQVGDGTGNFQDAIIGAG